MTLTIDLTPEQEAQLAAAAKQNGLDPAALANKLVTEHLPEVTRKGGEDWNRTAYHEMTPRERIRAMDALAQKNRGLLSCRMRHSAGKASTMRGFSAWPI